MASKTFSFYDAPRKPGVQPFPIDSSVGTTNKIANLDRRYLWLILRFLVAYFSELIACVPIGLSAVETIVSKTIYADDYTNDVDIPSYVDNLDSNEFCFVERIDFGYLP